jgi:uncharacterized protein YbjT (DUF2867 family)
MNRSAVLLGGSGLVGSACLEVLLEEDSYATVHALVRRPLPVTHPKLIQHEVSFDELDAGAPHWSSDAVFCCLGATFAKAGSEEAFRRADHDYVLAAARLAHNRKANSFLVISSLGADAGSRIIL